MTYIVPVRRTARAAYDFSVDGGAIGSIVLRGDKIPSGAAILDTLIRVAVAPTSGGAATIALQAESAGDIQTAAAVSGAPWSTTGTKHGTLTATTAPVTTTAERSITAVVATATLTAGQFLVLVTYTIPQF